MPNEEHTERLQKVIAQAGIASRRHAEVMIQEGRVAVNDRIVSQLGTKVAPHDHVSVDGVPLEGREKKVYYLLNKPRGVITSTTDDKERQTVRDILKEVTERVYPVGRLDYDTTGALLLTNDGAMANTLMHPKTRVDKVYVAKVKGIVTEQHIAALQKGLVIEGKRTAPAKAVIQSIDTAKRKSVVQLTIHEGRYHQVKKMFAKLRLDVEKLRRERYAFLDVLGLQPGEYRRLTHQEVGRLQQGDYRYYRYR